MTASVVSPSGARQTQLVQRLRELFEDVSGFELADADPALSFVELGLDSLTLTQVALQLKKTFALNITFRQLMEQHRSFDALSAYLDATLPPDAAGAPAGPAGNQAVTPSAAQGAAPVAPVAAIHAAPAVLAVQPVAAPLWTQPLAGMQPVVQQVIQQQMALMAQQLALLQGQSLAQVAMPAPEPGPVAVSAPALPAALAPIAAPVATPVAAGQGGPAASAPEDEAALVHRTYDVKKAFGAIARIHTAGTDMSERQTARLDAFMRRYIDKTQRSKSYTIEHRPHLADPNWTIPAGFDKEGFLASAKSNFITLQSAWDRADISSLRAMMTDEMLLEIQQQLSERETHTGASVNLTEVVMLEAQLLGIEDLPDAYMASVEFNGMIREEPSAGPSPFREVWNMTKPKSGGSGWLVAGVQALQ